MSNSIWHKYDIKDMPSLTREILARNGSHHNVCIINREDWEQGFCDWIDRWAYVADIIAQADKAERLQKAVDMAVNALKSAGTHNSINCIARGDDPVKDDVGTTINSALNKIKQLIKD